MKKLLLPIIIAVFASFSYSFAQDSFVVEDTTASDFDVTNALTNVNDLKSNVDTLTQELYDMDAKERTDEWNISDKYRQTREEIVNVIANINRTTSTVDDMLKKITLFKKQILSASEELKSARAGMTDTRDYIQDFSNFIYKLDNKLYNENDSIDNIKLIINSDNIPVTLANDYMVQSMLSQLDDLMQNFTESEEKQIALIKKLTQLKIQSNTQIKDFGVEIEKLQQKKNYLVQFLSLYKNDKSQRQVAIDQLFDSTKWVYDKISSLVNDIKKWVYKTDFNMDEKIKELQSIEKNDTAYPLSWPIYPISEIETYFGDELFQKQYGVPHIGIQIKAEQWTPVYSARDGVVYFVSKSEQMGGINRLMIVHSDGYITIYQYMNTIDVQAGDIVRRGQFIWKSWWEPGTRGAGFISKGPNLTFAVFKDGMAYDPLNVLDASIVVSKNTLPDQYQIKYLRDKYSRAIDITDLQLMTWDSLAIRENQFLARYGVGIYREPAFREDAVDGTNIDPDVVICIGFAESTLGKYLTTTANIGNVGNTDSGLRKSFYSALAGARSIALTLNNAFLWNYHTINQLSRYGNPNGKIYASSPINWQTNVLKCLSQIKGYYIPEDFSFRIGLNPNLKTVGSGN